jgi:uncharacterized protein (DUF885 family)
VKTNRLKMLAGGVAAMVMAWTSGATGALAQRDHEALTRLYGEFRAVTVPNTAGGVPDYTPAAMTAQLLALQQFQARLAAIDESEWSVPQQADYMLVLAEMRGLEFQHRVLQPWKRDPAYYSVTNLGFGPKLHGAFNVPQLPVSPEVAARLRTELEAVPAILAQARINLTDPHRDLAMLAIVQKDVEINVFTQLAAQARLHHPELVGAAEAATEASRGFRDWLKGIETDLPPYAGVGAENYDWYLKYVLLFPYTAEEIRIIGEREHQRVTSWLAMEQHRNRNTRGVEPLTSREAFDASRMEADNELLAFLRDNEIVTIPDYVQHNPGEGPYILPSERDPARKGLFEPPLDLHFFFQAEFRDPRPLRAHNLPGHAFDRLEWARDERPIRGENRLYFVNGVRTEGWAFYLEELILQMGMLDERPTGREIDYVLAAKRAARLKSELNMHANRWTYMQARESLVSSTPRWMEPDDAIAAFDIELYLRQPGYGIGYYMGKVELEKLLAERYMDLRDDFVLGQFHDQFRASGALPISLIRWEMTGRDNEVATMRQAPPIPQPRN